MNLGVGSQLERKDMEGNKVKWSKKEADPRIRLSPLVSIENEEATITAFDKKIRYLENKLGKKLNKATHKNIEKLLERE